MKKIILAQRRKGAKKIFMISNALPEKQLLEKYMARPALQSGFVGLLEPRPRQQAPLCVTLRRGHIDMKKIILAQRRKGAKKSFMISNALQ